jgi:hypothetical protein
MAWVYHQRSGLLEYKWEHKRHRVGTGYSGKGQGLNNPQMEAVSFQGPIPRGRYRIGPMYHHPHKGPHVMNLTPIGHNARNRDYFRIHGDKKMRRITAPQRGALSLNPRYVFELALAVTECLKSSRIETGRATRPKRAAGS